SILAPNNAIKYLQPLTNGFAIFPVLSSAQSSHPRATGQVLPGSGRLSETSCQEKADPSHRPGPQPVIRDYPLTATASSGDHRWQSPDARSITQPVRATGWPGRLVRTACNVVRNGPWRRTDTETGPSVMIWTGRS